MKNWIELSALGSSLATVQKRFVCRALSLATRNISEGITLIDSDRQAQAHGIAVDALTLTDGGVGPVEHSMTAPLVLCLVIQNDDLSNLDKFFASTDPQKKLLQKTIESAPQDVHLEDLSSVFPSKAGGQDRLNVIRKITPVIAIAHTMPAKDVAIGLRALETIIRGYPEQRLRWYDISDPASGLRHTTWPAENYDKVTAEMRASVIVPASQRTPLPTKGDDLWLHLDTPWCWLDKQSSTRSSRRRSYSDPNTGHRAELLTQLEAWMKRGGEITVVSPERKSEAKTLQPELEQLLSSKINKSIGWLYDRVGAPLLDILTQLTPEELADIRHAHSFLSTHASQTETGNPEAAVNAYEALVNGQISSVERIKPPDLKTIGGAINLNAKTSITSFSQLLTSNTAREIKHRDATAAILSRLCATHNEFLDRTTPTVKSGRNKIGDYSSVIEISGLARQQVSERVLDLLRGIAIAESQCQRFYWLRTLRPRYTDQIMSLSVMADANPRLPVLENAHLNFRLFSGNREEIVAEIEREIDWPKPQRVPALWNAKSLKGEFRKIGRVVGLLLGLTALAGLSSQEVTNGFYEHILDEKTVTEIFVNKKDGSGKKISACIDVSLSDPRSELPKDKPIPVALKQQECRTKLEAIVSDYGAFQYHSLETSTKMGFILSYVLKLILSPFVGAVLLIFAVLSFLITYLLFAIGRKDILTDKRVALEDALLRATSTKLQELIGVWHKHLEGQNKLFIAQFEEQVNAFLRAPLDVAHAAYEVTANQLREEAVRAKAAITSNRQERIDDQKRIQDTRKNLKDSFKRVLTTIGWKDK